MSKIVNHAVVDQSVHNGHAKMVTDNCNFMTATDIYESVMQLKLKNSEGYDRIPQRILIDGINALIVPLSHLFSLIYNKCQIPEQWLIALLMALVG